MNDGSPHNDRGLIGRLDWARPDGASRQPVPSPETTLSKPSGAIDVGAILDAVQLTATSMTAMAARIRELEAHAEAFLASNGELEEHNRRLGADLDDIVRQRDALAASLQAESERKVRLEAFTAQHVSRATSLERDLGAERGNLERVVAAVRTAFGLPGQVDHG